MIKEKTVQSIRPRHHYTTRSVYNNPENDGKQFMVIRIGEMDMDDTYILLGDMRKYEPSMNIYSVGIGEIIIVVDDNIQHSFQWFKKFIAMHENSDVSDICIFHLELLMHECVWVESSVLPIDNVALKDFNGVNL